MKKSSTVEFLLDRSDLYPYSGESEADFIARVRIRQAERRSRMTPDELDAVSNTDASLEAAAKELGYL